MNQSVLDANTCNWLQARENLCEQAMTVFGFTSDWPRKWNKFFNFFLNQSEHSNAEPLKMHITFGTQLNSVLSAYT